MLVALLIKNEPIIYLFRLVSYAWTLWVLSPWTHHPCRCFYKRRVAWFELKAGKMSGYFFFIVGNMSGYLMEHKWPLQIVDLRYNAIKKLMQENLFWVIGQSSHSLTMENRNQKFILHIGLRTYFVNFYPMSYLFNFYKCHIYLLKVSFGSYCLRALPWTQTHI